MKLQILDIIKFLLKMSHNFLIYLNFRTKLDQTVNYSSFFIGKHLFLKFLSNLTRVEQTTQVNFHFRNGILAQTPCQRAECSYIICISIAFQIRFLHVFGSQICLRIPTKSVKLFEKISFCCSPKFIIVMRINYKNICCF